jgi:hypothetical protein
VSEQEVAAEALTSARGTEAWYLARFCRRQGLSVTFDFRPGLPPDLSLPAMVGVRLGTVGHFIAVLERLPATPTSPAMIRSVDSISGERTEAESTFLSRSQLSGFHLSIGLRKS